MFCLRSCFWYFIMLFVLHEAASQNDTDANLDKMFKDTGLVPAILEEVPPRVMDFKVTHDGSLVNAYEVDILSYADSNEPSNVTFAESSQEFSGYLSLFVYGKTREFIHLLYLNAKSTGEMYNSEFKVVKRWNSDLNNKCTFLGTKSIFRIVLGLEYGAEIPDLKGIAEKYVDDGEEFKTKDFVVEHNITVKEGAAIKIQCDDFLLVRVNLFLLPCIFFLALVGIIGSISKIVTLMH